MIIRTTNKAHFKTANDKVITLKKKKGNKIMFFSISKNLPKFREDILISKMIPKHMQHVAKQAAFYVVQTKRNLLMFQKLSDIYFIASDSKDTFQKVNLLDLNIGDEIICVDDGKFLDNYYFDEITDISFIEDNMDNSLLETFSNYFLHTENGDGIIINNILVM